MNRATDSIATVLVIFILAAFASAIAYTVVQHGESRPASVPLVNNHGQHVIRMAHHDLDDWFLANPDARIIAISNSHSGGVHIVYVLEPTDGPE